MSGAALPLFVRITSGLVKDNNQLKNFVCVETKGTSWWLRLVLVFSASSALWHASLCQPLCLVQVEYGFDSHQRLNSSGLSKKCHFSSQRRVSSATFQAEVQMFALVDWLGTSPTLPPPPSPSHVTWPFLSTLQRKRKQAFLSNLLLLRLFLRSLELSLCNNRLAIMQFSSSDIRHFFQLERNLCWHLGGPLLWSGALGWVVEGQPA